MHIYILIFILYFTETKINASFLYNKIIITTGDNGNDLSNTEVIDITGDCSTQNLPNYPILLRGATGVYINGTVVICGGGYPETRKCYSLKQCFSIFFGAILFFMIF